MKHTSLQYKDPWLEGMANVNLEDTIQPLGYCDDMEYVDRHQDYSPTTTHIFMPPFTKEAL